MKVKVNKKIIAIVILFIISFFNAMPAYALSIVVHVPEKYTEVNAGERFYFEIDIKYPENPSRKDLRLNYEILKDGEIIAQSKVLKAIETQSSFIDFIVIPDSADNGMHTINVNISDYEQLSEDVSATFNVVNKSSGQIQLYFFILLGAIVLVGGLVVFEFMRLEKSRKKAGLE